jgi:hypothetical protein
MDPQHIHLIFECSLIESELDHCLTKNTPCGHLLSSSPRILGRGLVLEFCSLRADGRQMPITAYDADGGCRPMFSQPHLVSILPKGTRKPIKWSALRPGFPSARCISHTSTVNSNHVLSPALLTIISDLGWPYPRSLNNCHTSSKRYPLHL